jgi:hypothetical protein
MHSNKENEEQNEFPMIREAHGKTCWQHNENWNAVFQNEVKENKLWQSQTEKLKNGVIKEDLKRKLT